ncbi:acyl-CoA thioesterase [Aliiroseovarius subalbicans]|uniref:acyl-CoA thioesterase n=1 Tax=Aliiroseovarius subalbicans TaxID=2925840 RepID=UPI001F5977F7|nr:acyl-CoA thioesterase [Aliiroseovarius subalbicans]MCI2399787.1 thioesterase family protein [Aliiroseovarius subalbicans]
MYPVVRILKEMLLHRKPDGLGVLDTHVSHHICWPWDLDLWGELNNGRTLTLYDLGRVPMGNRIGLTRALMKHRWGIVVAGASVRYRKRVTIFQRFEMRTRVVGWDARFVYIEQSMWRGGDCTSHILIRGAVTGRRGVVPPDEVIEAIGVTVDRPDLPRWVQAWIDADHERPWPPQS